MGKYFTQFEDTTIGSELVGWTIRGGALWTAAPLYGTPAVKRRYCGLQNSGTSDFTNIVTWNAIDADANRAKANPLTCFKVDDTTVEELQIYVRGAGSATVTDFYRVRLKKTGASNLNIDKMAASAYTAALGSATVTLSAGKSYFVRMDANGTAIKARVWDAALGMAGEPTTWDVSVTDSSVTAAGWVGFGCRHSTLSQKVAPFNFFAVGTNGDAAVCPRTNAERTAALKDQSKEFIFLAEMSFAKYVPGSSPYVGKGWWYVSKGGYTSHPQDSPPNQPYPSLISRAPTIRRSIDLTLTGEAKLAFGSMTIHNPVVADRPIRYTAVDLNGSSQYAFAASSASLNFGTGSFSFMVRGRFDDFTNPKTFPSFGKQGSPWNAAAGWGIGASYSATSVFAFFNDGTNHVQGNIALDVGYRPTDLVGKMVEIILVVDRAANTARLVVNGVLQSGSLSLASLTGSVSNSESLRVGLSVGWYHDGLLDEVRAWSRALSLSEAVAIYRRRSVDTTGSMVLLWPCNEGSGTSLTDYSGNSNTGTLANSPSWVTGTYIVPEAENYSGAQGDALRMRWNRGDLLGYYGCRDWPKHDFIPVVVGRLGMPRAESEDAIVFPISDISDALNAPLQTKFTSGDRSGQYKPKLLGDLQYGWIEPPMTDEATYTFTLSDAAIDIFSGLQEEVLTISDNGVYLAGASPAVSAVDTGTETLTFGSAHGALVDALVLPQGLPAPFVDGSRYYVIAAGFSATTLRLSATRGGAAVNITGTTTGGTLNIYNYVLDKAAATVRLLAKPVGRVLMGWIKGGSGNYPDQIYSDLVFTGLGLSLNNKDSTSFAALNSVATTGGYKAGIWLDTNYHDGREELNKFARGTGTWWGFTPDGLMQVAMVSLPAATATRSFNFGAVATRGVKQVNRIRAKDFSAGLQSCVPWFVTRGPMQIAASNTASLWTQAQGEQLKSVLSAYSYGAAGIPIDDHPDRIDADKDTNFDFLMYDGTSGIALRSALVTLFKSNLGIWEFPLKREAVEASLGETISIDYDRQGFKQYTTADPPSPDNVAAFDARLCVVIDYFFDFDDTSGFPARLQAFRKIPGLYPTTNLN